MNITQVSARDVLGGAEQVARLLHVGYRERGHHSCLVVGEKETSDSDVVQIPQSWLRQRISGVASRVLPRGWYGQRLARYLANPGAAGRAFLGRDSFAYPASHGIPKLSPSFPDVLHFHNLHGSYFDLRALRSFAQKIPIAITMHDAWLLTGGCTHPLDCTRFRTGCGRCPYRKLHFRASLVDSTASNLRRKREALAAGGEKFLHIIAPSRWLIGQISGSLLEPAMASAQVIPNGVDTDVFTPAEQSRARAALGLPAHAFVVMHASIGATRNVSKGFDTMQESLAKLAAHTGDQQVFFVIVGDDGAGHAGRKGPVDGVNFRFVSRLNDARQMATCYAASDVYLQGSVADTFPTTILEAMACGRPVVATAVGGIPEQVIDGETGWLVPVSDSTAMASRLIQLHRDARARDGMGRRAAEKARTSYPLALQVQAHLRLYREIIACHPENKSATSM